MPLNPDSCLSMLITEVRDKILRLASKLRSSSGSNIWLKDAFLQANCSKSVRDLRCLLVQHVKEKHKTGKQGFSKA